MRLAEASHTRADASILPDKGMEKEKPVAWGRVTRIRARVAASHGWNEEE